MIYEVINPSDEVTIEADNELVAAVAVLVLGNGQYGVLRTDRAQALPIFVFGGADEWLTQQGIPAPDGLSEYLTTHALELATCLESAMCCSMGTRAAILAAVGDTDREKQRAALARYNDASRSSMNDICGRAHQVAQALRVRAAEAQKAAPIHWSDDDDSPDVRHVDPAECATLIVRRHLERYPHPYGRPGCICMHAYTPDGDVVETRDIDVEAIARAERIDSMERMGEPFSAGERRR